MKSVSGKNASVVMCRRCRRETLPQLKLPSWKRDVLRKAADGMLEPESRKGRRKGRRIREALATRDFGTIKLIIQGLSAPAQELEGEECPDCLRLKAA